MGQTPHLYSIDPCIMTGTGIGLLCGRRRSSRAVYSKPLLSTAAWSIA